MKRIAHTSRECEEDGGSSMFPLRGEAAFECEGSRTYLAKMCPAVGVGDKLLRARGQPGGPAW